jgi:hypothetical protein
VVGPVDGVDGAEKASPEVEARRTEAETEEETARGVGRREGRPGRTRGGRHGGRRQGQAAARSVFWQPGGLCGFLRAINLRAETKRSSLYWRTLLVPWSRFVPPTGT